MKKIKPLVITIFFSFLFLYMGHDILAAGKYKFNKLDVAKGLSNSEVRSIFKDSNGFMWFGTPSGLNRYDGYEVITYKQDFINEQGGESNNDIWRIFEAVDGKLWLQTPYAYTIYDLKQEQFIPDIQPIVKELSGLSSFWKMYIDLAKNIWFVGWDDVRVYSAKNNSYKILEQGTPDGLSRGLITDIAQGENRYWFLFDNGLLECMDAQTHRVIRRDSTLLQKKQLKNVREMRLFVDSAEDVWIYNMGEEQGVACYSNSRNVWEMYSSKFSHPYYISNDNVFSMEEDQHGNIWVGTDHGGVTLLNKKTKKFQVLENDKNDPLSLPQNTARSLYRDDKDIMWIGTYKNGVSYYSEDIYKFSDASNISEMPYSDVNCFLEDPLGNLWIGSNGGGLLYYDRKQDKYTTYKHVPGNRNSPAGDVIVSLTYDKLGRLWIGYYLAGLDCYDGKTFTNYRTGSEYLNDNNVWNLLCDRNGNLWMGTLNGGVSVVDISTGKRITHMETNGSVYSIIQKKSGEVLVGSQSGLYVYSEETDNLLLYEKEIFADIQLNRYDIYVLNEDSRGLLWIGTRNGLFVFNPYTQELRLFRTEDGLAADLVQSILEDGDRNMWVATNSGLTYIRVSTSKETPGYFYNMTNYDKSDGLRGEQFNYDAGLVTSKSELVFGGIFGFNIFMPTSVVTDIENPRVTLTDFQIYNKSIRPGEEYEGRKILTESITITKEITLNHSDNYFSLSFAALDYTHPGKAYYYYKLDGFNEQWLEADRDSRKVTYTNLNPGQYTFYLKAVNNNGGGEEFPIALKIHIRPPFWQSVWAWIFYTLFIVGLILFFRHRMVKKSESKLEYARESLRNAQQHRIDEMKLRFFTNVSHEFRTPLTLIISPLEELLKKAKEPEDRESLSMIRRNAMQLLRLVNQLLDFRRLDEQGHMLHKSLGDIVQFVKGQAQFLTEAMERKQITFTVVCDQKQLYMWFDADKLSKVLVNLLYNAIKFTPAGGHIELKLEHKESDKIRITVTDDGAGIPEGSLDRVFERFYQVENTDKNKDQGSSIGLHIAKEFVTLHGGEIWAEHVTDGGSRFVVVIPCEQGEVSPDSESELPDENIEEEDVDEIIGLEKIESQESSLPKLLIVDDNDDFRLFLTGKLKDQYVVLQAADGVAGLEIAFREIPDMILTDVMMPKMDGIEMSKKIKEDIRTSHIPLVLLTAKSGEESKLEGLTAGADDYITKPFNMDILLIKIHNLVEARKLNREIFKEQIKIEPSKIAVSSLDEKLIQKALEYTETNISNPDFSVEELSRELGMSRVHLYKKLSSLTGKTPIEFIRVIRLKRAAQLLEESQLTVSEIAYEVGFNNPKYFRKYFKDEFNVLPSQYGSRNEKE